MTKLTRIAIEISPGELVDRYAILRLKVERIADPAKLEIVRPELTKHEALVKSIAWDDELQQLSDRLLAINGRLWDIEEAIRVCEHASNFGAEFIALARSVYIQNDERAATKRAIDGHLRSSISEVKSYTSNADRAARGPA